jgi:oligopeptide transport system substrate-binding protein
VKITSIKHQITNNSKALNNNVPNGFGFLGFVVLVLFVICNLLFVIYSPAYAKDFDGIWFLGFNLHKAPFNELAVRQAVASCLDEGAIAKGIMEEETEPIGFIPPGLPGYDPLLVAHKNDPAYAKSLMKRAGYPLADKRLKKLSLLHTDGIKTIAIAKQLQQELKLLGMKLELIEVSYRDTGRWEKELKSGRHQLFLMGYKADRDQPFSSAEALAGGPADSAALLEPLFRTAGPANFTGYANPTVDMLFDQLSVLPPTLGGERDLKLKSINGILYKELPGIVLFYIEKL